MMGLLHRATYHHKEINLKILIPKFSDTKIHQEFDQLKTIQSVLAKSRCILSELQNNPESDIFHVEYQIRPNHNIGAAQFCCLCFQ